MKNNYRPRSDDSYHEYNLDSSDLEFLNHLQDKIITSNPISEDSMRDVTEKLLDTLREADKNKQEIPFYSKLTSFQREAAKVLAQSGEASFYKNNDDKLCIKYDKPSLLAKLFFLHP